MTTKQQRKTKRRKDKQYELRERREAFRQEAIKRYHTTPFLSMFAAEKLLRRKFI